MHAYLNSWIKFHLIHHFVSLFELICRSSTINKRYGNHQFCGFPSYLCMLRVILVNLWDWIIILDRVLLVSPAQMIVDGLFGEQFLVSPKATTVMLAVSHIIIWLKRSFIWSIRRMTVVLLLLMGLLNLLASREILSSLKYSSIMLWVTILQIQTGVIWRLLEYICFLGHMRGKAHLLIWVEAFRLRLRTLIWPLFMSCLIQRTGFLSFVAASIMSKSMFKFSLIKQELWAHHLLCFISLMHKKVHGEHFIFWRE